MDKKCLNCGEVIYKKPRVIVDTFNLQRYVSSHK